MKNHHVTITILAVTGIIENLIIYNTLNKYNLGTIFLLGIGIFIFFPILHIITEIYNKK